MARTAVERQSLSDVPLPLALTVASFAAPLGVLCWIWLRSVPEHSSLSLGDVLGMLQIGYLIGMPFALAASLLIAWPLMAWMRRIHAVAWTSTLSLSIAIGVGVYVIPTTLSGGGGLSFAKLAPIATMGATPGLFAGVLLCAILRPPLRVRRCDLPGDLPREVRCAKLTHDVF